MSRPGPDGTPPTGGDFGDFLRHALHAAADQIEPRPDGLERIRARVRSGPAYASKHSAAAKAAASGGFLAERVRRWNAMRGGSSAHGSSAHGSGRGHARRPALVLPGADSAAFLPASMRCRSVERERVTTAWRR